MIEFIAALLTLLSAYYTVKEKVICWPLAIVSTLIYIYLLYVEKLYGQVFADTIIVFQCIYGWYYWDVTDTEPPTWLSINKMLRDLLISIILCFITIYFVIRYTNNPQPELDIITTYSALLANWYLAKKYINGFMIWIFTDLLLVYMFFNQHMYWSAGLYIILIEFARQGQFAWIKSLKTD